MGLIRNILFCGLCTIPCGFATGQTIDPNFKSELREEIRIPDKWELILETVTDDDSKVLNTMTSFRDNNYEKLQILNYHFCLCEDEWREAIKEYDLLETSLYLPLAMGFNSSENNCDTADVYFMKMAEFSGKSSEYINHLKSIWGDEDGFENALYNYRITIRLLENIVLPRDCKDKRIYQKTHKLEKGQTLYRLSIIYGVSVEEIQEANSLGSSTLIQSGSILVIP